MRLAVRLRVRHLLSLSREELLVEMLEGKYDRETMDAMVQRAFQGFTTQEEAHALTIRFAELYAAMHPERFTDGDEDKPHGARTPSATSSE
jgi:hypothetical protein